MRAPSSPWKRSVDIVASAIGLIALAPLLAIVAAAIWLGDGGPALYRQVRVGRGGATFRIVKFRSMKVARERGGSELTASGDPRVTPVGRFIRRYKIDELPQLWNVLLGQMSLVGPRPETPALLERYTLAQRSTIHSLRPGLTDWASLLLTSEGDLLAAAADPAAYYLEVILPMKCELWRLYRGEHGLLTDLRILAATVWAILAPNAQNIWLSESARMSTAAALRVQPSSCR